MKYKTDHRIFPLGDSAITVDFGNIIDEEINLNVLSRYQQLIKVFRIEGKIPWCSWGASSFSFINQTPAI